VHGKTLSSEVEAFTEEVFAAGGALLCGAGGGRFVYELRRRFDVFFKISPLRTVNGVPDASRLKPAALADVDILVTRENSGGVYQGAWSASGEAGSRSAEHRFGYGEPQVRRFLECSARLAAARRGLLTVVWKESGVPTVSALWKDCAEQAAGAAGVRVQMVDVDLMAYRLIQEAAVFDVVAAPNMCGDARRCRPAWSAGHEAAAGSDRPGSDRRGGVGTAPGGGPRPGRGPSPVLPRPRRPGAATVHHRAGRRGAGRRRADRVRRRRRAGPGNG
jgi:3-isopropylmalate dehydrogenase